MNSKKKKSVYQLTCDNKDKMHLKTEEKKEKEHLVHFIH